MGGEHTFEDIDRVAATLESMVTGVDVALLTGPGATRLATRLITVERVLASARSRALRRAAEANQWRQAGERSAASWAAKMLGTTTGHAAAELETAELLESLPATRAARDTGSISDLQAREIAGAATADPSAETLLLRRAAVDDTASLRRRCAKVRAAAETDEAAARERIRRDRRFRTWVDPEGGFCFNGRGLPEDGAALLAAIKPHQDTAYHAARRTGGHDGPDAYAYDGLITLARNALRHPTPDAPAAQPTGRHKANGTKSGGAEDTGLATCTDERGRQPRVTCPDAETSSSPGPLFDTPAPTSARPGEVEAEDQGVTEIGADGPAHPTSGQRPPLPGVKVIVRIDHAALLRGHTTPGEVCEIAGVGPIPVATARHLARDAFLTAVTTDGIDIKDVVHLGRAATAHQRTALEARGMTCAVPGCGTTTRLEIDHVDGWATTRRTHIDQLDWLCHHHHTLKTNHSYRLAGPPGNRTWHPPDEPGPPPATATGPIARSRSAPAELR